MKVTGLYGLYFYLHPLACFIIQELKYHILLFLHMTQENAPQEAPKNMLIAMGIAAFLCVAIGVFPDPLYSILPYKVDFVPYTTTHVVTQLQLLLFSALAFGWLMRTGLYPPELKSTNLDFDWIYRRLLPNLIRKIIQIITTLDRIIRSIFINYLENLIAAILRHHGPNGILARTNQVGASVAIVIALLALFIIVFFFTI